MVEPFQALEDRLSTFLALMYPRFDASFFLETNASWNAVGTLLAQRQDNKKIHPIVLNSWMIDRAMRKYSASEHDAQNVIFALNSGGRLH